jgi:hypothetical protein
LHVIDLAMRVQSPQGIAADRAQCNDLLAWLQRKGIVDFDICDIGIEGKIVRAPIVNLREPTGFAARDPRHVAS